MFKNQRRYFTQRHKDDKDLSLIGTANLRRQQSRKKIISREDAKMQRLGISHKGTKTTKIDVSHKVP